MSTRQIFRAEIAFQPEMASWPEMPFLSDMAVWQELN